MPESPVIFSKKKEFCFRVQYKTLWPTARLGIVRAEGVKAIEYLWSFLFETIGWLSLLWVMMRNSLFLAPCWPKKESKWFVWGKLFSKKGKSEFVWAQPTGKNTANFCEKWSRKMTKNFKEMKQPEDNHYVLAQKGWNSNSRQFKTRETKLLKAVQANKTKRCAKMLTKGCEQPTAEFNENWAEGERVFFFACKILG